MTKKSGKSAPKKGRPKAVSKKPALKTSAEPRRLKRPAYKGWRPQKRFSHPIKLPNAWKLTKAAALILWANKGLFAGVTLVYGALNIILAQGLSSGTNLTELKDYMNQVFTGNLGALASGLSVFVVMLSSAGNTSNPAAGAYQLFLTLIASLAIIWTLRQVLAGNTKPRIRDAYYHGMYPLVPFVLVLVVIGLQLIPLILGSTLYGWVVGSGIAVYAVEQLAWILVCALLAVSSLYMLTSSLFALYVATLPDMTPMKALRSARELVRYRRWTVLRKILWLPVALLIAGAVIMLPIIIWLTPLAALVFFLLTMSALTAAHAYMYNLYRELLNE